MKGFYVDTINAMDDHMHMIIDLKADISIAKTMQLIKGECSHWINKQGLTQNKFEWADEYFVESLSLDSLDRVRKYIWNQEEHHRKKTFAEECEEFLKKYNFKRSGC